MVEEVVYIKETCFFQCLVAEVRKSDVREIEEEETWCGVWLLAGGWADHWLVQ